MNVLILFESIEGQTGKIARFVAEEVQKAGHEVELHDAGGTAAAPPFDAFDKIILAAPVHERRHPEQFEVLLAGRRHDMEAHDTLLISVSLSAAFPEGVEEANEYLTELKMRTGFTPSAEMLVAGAVRTSRYDYFATQVVRHVVLRDREVDPSDGEHEFTDWNAVAAKVADFLDGSSA